MNARIGLEYEPTATALAKRAIGKTLYNMDEPTTGLHFADVEKLIGVLNRLVSAGNWLTV